MLEDVREVFEHADEDADDDSELVIDDQEKD